MAVDRRSNFLDLLIHLSENISEKDLKKLKFRCSQYISKGQMENITDALDLFEELDNQKVITSDTLDQLKMLINKCFDKRHELLEAINEFEKGEWTHKTMAVVDRRSTFFRSFIVHLCENIGRKDFNNLKFICHDHIPASRMEKVTEPVDLFNELICRGVITDDTAGLDELKRLIHKSTDGNLELVENIKQFEKGEWTETLSSVSTSPPCKRKRMAGNNSNCICKNPDQPSSSTILTWTRNLTGIFILDGRQVDSVSARLTWRWDSMDDRNSCNNRFGPSTIIKFINQFTSENYNFDIPGQAKPTLSTLKRFINKYTGGNNDNIDLHGNPKQDFSTLTSFTGSLVVKDPDQTSSLPIITRQEDLMHLMVALNGCEDSDSLKIISEALLVDPFLSAFGCPLTFRRLWLEIRQIKDKNKLNT